MVAKNLDRFLKATSKIQAIPRRKILNKVVDTCYTVLDKHAIDLYEGVEVNSSTPILHARNSARSEGCKTRVVVAMLLHIDGMPMLNMRYSKDKVKHLGRALLRLHECLWGVWVNSAKLGLGNIGLGSALGEDTRAVCETVYDGRIELAQHEAQSFLELIVNDHMLVCSKETMRQVIKGADFGIEVFPFCAEDVELAGFWF
jgi:hypothetical protein